MSASSGKKRGASKSHVSDIPLVEWIVGGIGVLIVVGIVGLLIYDAVSGDKSPPDVKLTVEGIVPQRNGYLVKLGAANQGGEAAARVGLKVELLKQGQIVETRETQVEYLPGRSARAAGAFFKHDPRIGELRLHACGYEEP